MNRLLAVQLDHGDCKARFFRDAGKTEEGKDHVIFSSYPVSRSLLLELEDTLKQDHGLTHYVYGNVMCCNLVSADISESLCYALTWYKFS